MKRVRPSRPRDTTSDSVATMVVEVPKSKPMVGTRDLATTLLALVGLGVLVLDDRLLDHQVFTWQPPDITGAYDKNPRAVRNAGAHGLVLRTVERQLLARPAHGLQAQPLHPGPDPVHDRLG